MTSKDVLKIVLITVFFWFLLMNVLLTREIKKHTETMLREIAYRNIAVHLYSKQTGRSLENCAISIDNESNRLVPIIREEIKASK